MLSKQFKSGYLVFFLLLQSLQLNSIGWSATERRFLTQVVII